MNGTTELLADERGQVLHLTINRPQRRNALTPGVIAGLAAAIDSAPGRPGLRAIVITGAGDQAFCAGADLQAGTAFRFDYSLPRQALADLLRCAHRATVPLIARVNGACMAGGMGLLSMCDLAVASEAAIFGLPEVKVGLFPAQVLAALQPLLPRRVLNEMCLSGEPIGARRALELGLVNSVGPDVDHELQALLTKLLDKSPSASRRALYTMKQIESMPFEQSIAFAESQIGLAALTEDAQEGQLAFREKRPPRWSGR